MCLAHYVSHYNITKSGSLRILYVDDAYFTQGKFYVGVAGVIVLSKYGAAVKVRTRLRLCMLSFKGHL